MKFGFVTCVELGLACMREIHDLGGTLDLVVTLRDDLAKTKSGRVYVDDFCSQNTIDLIKIKHINDAEAVNAIRARQIDWLFIIGWSQIAGDEVLSSPTKGVLGIHPTLLPEGRGRAPIPWAIIKGLERTGVTLFRLDSGVDTGDLVAQLELPIAERETATSLYSRIQDAHQMLLRKIWNDLATDNIELRTQDNSKASVWPARKPEDGRITPDMTVIQADRLVRGTTRPYPGAFWENGEEIIRVWAGRPAIGDATLEAGSFGIQLINGTYLATDFERERVIV